MHRIHIICPKARSQCAQRYPCPVAILPGSHTTYILPVSYHVNKTRTFSDRTPGDLRSRAFCSGRVSRGEESNLSVIVQPPNLSVIVAGKRRSGLLAC
jgi:hypothetical protein